MDIFGEITKAELDNFGEIVIEEFKLAIKIAGEQISSSNSLNGYIPSPSKVQEYSFTANFQKEAKEWGLSKADALDVYYTGYNTSKDVMVKEYNGYEIGIAYEYDPNTGIPVIDSIWKKE